MYLIPPLLLIFQFILICLGALLKLRRSFVSLPYFSSQPLLCVKCEPSPQKQKKEQKY